MKKIVVLFFAVALVFIGLLAKPAYSLPAFEVETTYYNNSKFQKIVGTATRFCDGSGELEGEITKYYKKSKGHSCNNSNKSSLEHPTSADILEQAKYNKDNQANSRE